MNAQQPVSSSAHLIGEFKRLYANHSAMDLTRLEDVYADNIVFRDPIHKIRGLSSLRDYLASMYDGITECRFEYLDELIGDDSAYIKWNMHFRHLRFNNKLITVRGATHIQFNGRISFHEDIYDLGELVYEHVPILGGITSWVKSRMAKLNGRSA